MTVLSRSLALLLFLTAPVPALAAASTQPYADPSQLDVPWPKHSFYKQPWRGFLETRSGHDFLQGVGVNYHSPGNDELAIRLLAETGFKTFRIEFGWGSVKWDETGLTGADKAFNILKLCKQYHIRPTLLMNAHHGVPCPVQFFDGKLAADAPQGAKTITLADAKRIVPGYSGLTGVTGYIAAEVIITAADEKTGVCQLSKPLPKELKAGPVKLCTLKYLPFFPVGTKEFEETAGGWLKYADILCKLVEEAGFQEYDLELWNELSFGSNFTHAKHYFERTPQTEALYREKDFLNEGGSAWEISRRTIEAVKAKNPRARCIWGWSNTTFFHTPIAKLPPGTDGQSYHPYGTGLRKLPEKETHKDHPEYNLERYTPTLDVRMPEGWAHTFIQTESLMRHLNPAARQTRPKGVEHFYHYMTEHGVVPAECGVIDDARAWGLKAKVALRSFCLWMNKGVDVLHYFQAYDKGAGGMGLLPPDTKTLPADAKWDQVATAPMRAVRNLTKTFEPSSPLPAATPLDLSAVEELSSPRKVFDGDATHPPLLERDVLAFLPWQCMPDRYVVAIYVMTYDITQTCDPRPYRLTLSGIPQGLKPRLYDPLTDKDVEVKVMKQDGAGVVVELPVVDYPRLLVIGR